MAKLGTQELYNAAKDCSYEEWMDEHLGQYLEALRAKDKEEIERLRKFELTSPSQEQLKEQLAATQLVVEQTRSALVQYGRHQNNSLGMCDMLKHSDYPCSCGFDEALALQVSTDALREHDAKVLEEAAKHCGRYGDKLTREHNAPTESMIAHDLRVDFERKAEALRATKKES